jgi:methyltransferase (TIGR00027 family)
MQPAGPSRTAFGAALLRAAHQLVDRPPVFADPLALKIVGRDAAAQLRESINDPAVAQSSPLRAFIAARSRFAEDSFAQSHAHGVTQYVLLGAGLDTFAYRHTHDGVTVFEVDHPATQAWKRQQLGKTEIAIPSSVVFAPVDFERESLREGLGRTGFDFAKPAFFTWLGVTPYLSRDSIASTLSFAASLPKESEIVFEYVEPRNSHDAAQNQFMAELSSRVAAAGEPFKSFFTPEEMAALLHGFSQIEDLDAAALNARYFAGRADGLGLRGRAHMVRAKV